MAKDIGIGIIGIGMGSTLLPINATRLAPGRAGLCSQRDKAAAVGGTDGACPSHATTAACWRAMTSTSSASSRRITCTPSTPPRR